MNNQELKELFKNTFNTVADGYDNSAMRFFPKSAGRIFDHLELKGNEHILDVATGTGNVALKLAEKLPDGQVTGIDFSAGMLSQANRKKTAMNLENVTFREMDMQSIDYPDNKFDIAVCAFGIFFVEEMDKQLHHITDKIKENGKVIITTFFENSFTPLVDIFFARLEAYGVEPPTLAWKKVANNHLCLSLFNEVGLKNIKCMVEKSGYYLKHASDWWYIIWNGGFRGLVNQLAEDELETFKKEHLKEIESLSTDEGIWLEMNIIYTIGSKGAP